MINEKEFKVLLNQLLEKELEYLRKRFMPYKRRPFLRNKVSIDLDLECDREKTLGYYENTRTDKNEWKYEHKIFLTDLSRERYEICCNIWCRKRLGIKRLRETIRHELIHAFVFEEFEEWEFIKNCHGDYSPIFLACLYWSGLDSPYPYTNKFKESDLYKNIEECKNYETIYIHLIRCIRNLESLVEEINKKINKDMKNYRKLIISFNQYEAGIIKKSYVSYVTRSKRNNELCIQKAEEMNLGIGFLVTPKDIMQNYERKFDNGEMATVHLEMASYVIGNEIKQQRTIRES